MKDSKELMARRIRSILLICNSYDSFSLEEDGRIDVQIANEYADLNLSNPPQIRRALSTADALALLDAGERFDLVITMYYVGEISVFDFARKAKAIDPSMPIVLLSSFSREVYRKIEAYGGSSIDYIFCWNWSTDLVIAIIKLLEDSMNAEADILDHGVQAILLVEDSIKYYSTYLPALYKLVLQQNTQSIKDALNEQQKILRKRSRPKILMATNYEDAVALYEKYKHNLLGVISDIGFVLHKGDPSSSEKIDAGVDLCKLVRKDNPRMSFLMQSSQASMRKVAEGLGAGFLLKSSKTLIQELGEYFEREFGFGDFVVTDPETGQETARARDLYEFEQLIRTIPPAAFRRLTEGNYLSKWIFARGMFPLGRILSPIRSEDYADIESHRKADVDAIHDYRISQGLGVVAEFNPDTYNDAIRFSRFGGDSIGGKARGLAFLNHILQKYNLYDKWEDVRVMVPRTLVITTDYFDRFIKENGLKYVINSDLDDAELLAEFVASPLPRELLDALRAFIRVVRRPLAVRSSSKLEDSYHQPFAGVYSTYMIPAARNEDQQLRMLSKAITSVYASVYFRSAKSYIVSSGNVISEEKMAIVIQEICGSRQGDYFFPTLSGVARSLNFYPVGHEKPEDGIVKLAYGLGKAVVDGEQVLRFSPRYPKHVLQTSTPDLTLRETQRTMYAMDLRPEKFKTSVSDSVNLARLTVDDCSGFPSLGKVVSTWDLNNMRMVDSAFPEGPKYITFAGILKYNTFPLADIVRTLLEIARDEMKCEVEMEFAADLESDGLHRFSVLQVRPISADSRFAEVNWDEIDCGGAWLKSECSLGIGWIEGVQDVVYLKEAGWDILKTYDIAREVSAINARMQKESRGYILIGFGRWGTSQPTLGVPVGWGDISEAKAIVECSLENFQIDPSQGTHFFQNLTSFNVGYINVNQYARPSEMLDFSVLDALPAVEETSFLRHVRFPSPLSVCIDGKTGRAMVKDNSQ
ncbi:MAG: phosphoenolpyruvate synthase [Bacteroidales bacterium]|nr:phosphoenolpyruvate synthase [Bacteroidales bacterium]